MHEGDLQIPELNILPIRPDFSGKVLEQLGQTISRRSAFSTGGNRVAAHTIIQSLKEAGNLTQAVIDTSGPSDIAHVYRDLGTLSRDERALAAVYYIQALLGASLDTESNIYRFASSVESKAYDRALLLFFLNMGQQRVGSNHDRYSWLNSLVQAVAEGPSNENPTHQVMVDYEEPIMIEVNGVRYRAQKEYTFVGRGIEPSEWAAQGGKVRLETSDRVEVRNLLHKRRSIGEGITGLNRQFKNWLGVAVPAR